MDVESLDRKIERLGEHKKKWAVLDISEKIRLLEGFVDRYVEIAESQVREAVEQKGFEAGSIGEGEEWIGGPLVAVRTGRLLLETLESIRDKGRPPVEMSEVRERPSGQLAVEVFPTNFWDRLLFSGFSAEVWLDPEVDRNNLFDHIGSFYRQEDPEGGVNLVLGAGNVSSIAPLDVLAKLYNEGHVCLLKMNPVNDYLGDYYETVFEEFVDAGFVEFAYGGADVGSYLCEHEGIEYIHMTGSDKTHDAIVFGTGDEGEERQEENNPKLDKPITSELGNVSPVIVVPGPWSKDDIEFHAESVASQLANNAGFNCDAVRVLIMPKDWDRREAFMEALRKTFAEIEPRSAYYPGAEEIYERFTEFDEETVTVGDADDDELPYAIILNVDPNDEDHPAFRDEAWCTVMAETRLPGNDPGEFLRNAVDFCNDVLWGTLNASVVIHPETRRDLGVTVDDAIDDLLYGTIVLNHWPAVGYGLGVTPWGAYPGHTLDNIQSGIGFVHNTLMFDNPQKTVVYGPFRVSPKPPWFATNENTPAVGPKLVEMEHNPSFGHFFSVTWSSLFG